MRGKCVANSNVRGSVSCSWLKATAYVFALLVTVQAAEDHLQYYDKVAQIVKEELEKVTPELANATKIATSVEVRVSEYLNQEGVVKVFAWERSVGTNLGSIPLDEAISTALKKITNENNREEVEERAKRLTMLPWNGKDLRTTDSDGNLCNNRATYTAKCHTEGSALNFTKATLFGESKQKKKDVAVAEMRVVVAHWFTREGLTEAARALWGWVNEKCIAKERSSHKNIKDKPYSLSQLEACISRYCKKRTEPLPRIILYMPHDSVSVASSAGQNDMDLSYVGQYPSRQLLVYILPAIPALGGRTVSEQELGKVTQMREAVERAVEKLFESKKPYSENDERFTQDKNLELAKSLQKKIEGILNGDSDQELGPFRVGVSVSVLATSELWTGSAHLVSFDRGDNDCNKEATTSYSHRCFADGSAFWHKKRLVTPEKLRMYLYVMVAIRPSHIAVASEQVPSDSSRVAGDQTAWMKIVRGCSRKRDRLSQVLLIKKAKCIKSNKENLLPPRAILMGPKEIVLNSVGLFGSQGEQDDFLELDQEITVTGKGKETLCIRLLPAREALRRTNLQPGEGTSFSVSPAPNGPQNSPPASNRRKREPFPQSASSPSKKPNLERGKSSAAGAGGTHDDKDGYPLKQNIRDIIEAHTQKLAAFTNKEIADTVQKGLCSDEKGMNILSHGVHISTLVWDTLRPGQFPRRTAGSSGVQGNNDEPVVQTFVADHLQQCHRAATLSQQCLQLGGAVEVEVTISDKPKSLLVIYWTTDEVEVLLQRPAEADTRARLATDVGNHLASLGNTFDDAHPLLLRNVFIEVFKKASSMHGGNPPTVPRILWVVPSATPADNAPGYTQQFGHVLATSMVYDFSRTINRLGVEIVDRLTLAVFMLPDFPTACAVNAVVPDDVDVDRYMRMLQTCM